jgi:hypothetical protein
MSIHRASAFASALLVVAAGCGGARARPSSGGDSALDAGSGADAGGGDPNGGPNGGIDPGAAPDCSERAKLVYLVDEANVLLSFAPATLAMTEIGTLRCPSSDPAATPFSMAVDRSATAWVLYSSGELFKVDTMTAACAPTTFAPDQHGFLNFGMGFVSDGVNTTAETLFVASDDAFTGGQSHLGTIAFPSLSLSVVGRIDGSPELTGTGDAKLWAFFPDIARPRIARLDKASGAESGVIPLDAIAGMPSAWAFAFWGGDFWVFLKRDTDTATQVHHVTAAGALSTVIRDAGRNIVGAGVSTCAPLQPIG